MGDGEVKCRCSWCGLEMAAAGGAMKCPHCGAARAAPREAPETYALMEERPTAPAKPAMRLGSPTKPRSGGGWRRLFHESARRDSLLSAEIVALLALSLADLFATYHLLRTHPKFYEANPVAQFVFARWNIAGMAVFKLSVVAFVVTVGEVAERQRPGLGRFVLLVGCLATAAVVLHGFRLAFGEMAG
ncbi:DUF5658 family protein [Paludisphaera sp.]|uniref:DUF5658 family protein n=1 Tax=Paludisphaera sp. TaxID=2017432 RepID=UPI00301C6E22